MKSRRAQTAQTSLVVCVDADGCEDLEPRKMYVAFHDRAAAREGYLRVVDESGEDYLYPMRFFAAVKPSAVRRIP